MKRSPRQRSHRYYMDHYMDANKTAGEETRWQLHKNAVQSWTSPGITATCPLHLFKLGEPDMQDIAGEAEMNS